MRLLRDGAFIYDLEETNDSDIEEKPQDEKSISPRILVANSEPKKVKVSFLPKKKLPLPSYLKEVRTLKLKLVSGFSK